MANISFEKLFSVVYKYLEQQLIDKAMFLCPHTITPTFDYPSTSSYCTQTHRHPIKYSIVLGGEGIKNLVGFPDSFTKVESHTEFSRVFKSIVAVFLHEMGHILYTDFTYDLTAKYTTKEEKAFAHHVYNILEDIVIEQRGIYINYPAYKKFFQFLNDVAFLPSITEYKDTDDSLINLTNFLLLKLRLGKRFTGTHVLYTQHEATLYPLLKTVLTTRDPIQRKKNTIPLVDFLLSLKKSEEELPESEGSSNTTSPENISNNSAKAQPLPVSSNASGEEEEDIFNQADSNSSDEDSEFSPSAGGGVGSLDNSSNKTFTEDSSFDLDSALEISSDILTCPHKYIKLAEHIESIQLSPSTRQCLIESELLGQSIKREIDVMKRLVKPRAVAGFTSGKLHIPSITGSKSTGVKTANVFNQQRHIGRAPDLAVSVLVDCSGSMCSGDRSYMAWRACQAISFGLDSLRIPFEIHLFTTLDASALTIGVKTLKDSYRTVKEYLPIISYSSANHDYAYKDNLLSDLFSCNVDESSLYYVYTKFKKLRQKDKLMLVLSDGATCGSEEGLTDLVSTIIKDDIGVIGIGLCSSAVARIYPEHKVFQSSKELSTLPEELGNLITKFYKKQGGLI